MEKELLRPASAAARYDMSRRTLTRLLHSDPSFPRPIHKSRRMVLFRRAELDAYFSANRAPAANGDLNV
ncbi:helix-turn-helix transcriptional regulator [Ottowia thiooxydans]|uniref:helix-turn-helix transcriptional regulator n=1 Tax=Ottowia thiooxydans TaxID=219182 RepID=UPI00055A1AED|nr:DNA-binding protein [Ottowia thiooxydans]